MRRFIQKVKALFSHSSVRDIAVLELRLTRLQFYEAREAEEWARALAAFNKAKIARLQRVVEQG
jgi:hypothetical protein